MYHNVIKTMLELAAEAPTEEARNRILHEVSEVNSVAITQDLLINRIENAASHALNGINEADVPAAA